MLPLQEVLLLLIYFCITWLLALLASSVFYARWHYGSLERSGLPAVIKPYFLGGSDPFFYKTVCCDEDTKRVRKYGRVFGVFITHFISISSFSFVSNLDFFPSVSDVRGSSSSSLYRGSGPNPLHTGERLWPLSQQKGAGLWTSFD